MDLWLEKHLNWLTKSLTRVSTTTFAWLSLSFSMISGCLLYYSADNTIYAAFAIPFLLLIIFFDSLRKIIIKVHNEEDIGKQLTCKLCDRLADLSIFLGFAFWSEIRIHLVLLGIISVLLVSYVGELGQALGAKNTHEGLLKRSHRIILVIFFSAVYSIRPKAVVADYSVFEVMFALFVPLASLTLLQRMDAILNPQNRKRDNI